MNPTDDTVILMSEMMRNDNMLFVSDFKREYFGCLYFLNTSLLALETYSLDI